MPEVSWTNLTGKKTIKKQHYNKSVETKYKCFFLRRH